jgi:hypothetical protein
MRGTGSMQHLDYLRHSSKPPRIQKTRAIHLQPTHQHHARCSLWQYLRRPRPTMQQSSIAKEQRGHSLQSLQRQNPRQLTCSRRISTPRSLFTFAKLAL